MAVFRFFKMAAARHLGFVVRLPGTTHGEWLVVFIVVQNLVGIGRVILKICEFQCYEYLYFALEGSTIKQYYTKPHKKHTEQVNQEKTTKK